MPINAKAIVLLLKKETTYGTDAAPVAATDAFLTRNYDLGPPVEVDVLERNLDLPTTGGRKVAITRHRRTMRFEVELAGSGTAATAAKWGRLLEACGMSAAASLTTPTRCEQKFAAAPFSSLTAYEHFGSERGKGVGARGTFGANFTAGEYPFLRLEYTMLLPATTPFDTAAPGTPDLTAQKDPVEVNTANTTFSLDGYAALLRSLDFEAGIEVVRRILVGADYVNLGDHAITGTLVIEAPNIASKDYLSTLRSGSEIALALQHGTVAGNIIKLDMPKVQITGISRGNEDGVVMYTMQFRANVNTGYDDILFTTM